MIYFYFRDVTGKLVMSGACADFEIEHQKCGDAILEIGQADINTQYYGKNGLTYYPEKPGDIYVFDYEKEVWVFNVDDATKSALEKRDELLKNGPDRVSPMWWSSMTTEQQKSWVQYRQDLLDITSQPNFPNDIIWPTPPSEGA